MLTTDEIETLLAELRQHLADLPIAPRKVVIDAGEALALGNGEYTIRSTEPYRPSPTNPVFVCWERTTTDHELISPTVRASVAEQTAQARKLFDGLRSKGA